MRRSAGNVAYSLGLLLGDGLGLIIGGMRDPGNR